MSLIGLPERLTPVEEVRRPCADPFGEQPGPIDARDVRGQIGDGGQGGARSRTGPMRWQI